MGERRLMSISMRSRGMSVRDQGQEKFQQGQEKARKHGSIRIAYLKHCKTSEQRKKGEERNLAPLF
jgi:hypothetical protein